MRNERSAAARRSPGSGRPVSIDHATAARMFSKSAAIRRRQRGESGPRSSASVRSANRAKYSAWRRRVGARSALASRRSAAYARMVSSIAYRRSDPGAADEHGQPAEQGRRVRPDEVVAPVDRRAQRPLPSRDVGRAVAEELEPGGEARRDSLEIEVADAGGGELDREGQAVETATDVSQERTARFVDG